MRTIFSRTVESENIYRGIPSARGTGERPILFISSRRSAPRDSQELVIERSQWYSTPDRSLKEA